MPQLQGPGIPFHRGQETRFARKGGAIGFGRRPGQESRIVIGEVFPQDSRRHGRILQLADRLHIHLGEGLGHEQAALIRQALDDGLRGGHLPGRVSCAEKLHCQSLLFAPGAYPVDSAWVIWLQMRVL